MPSPQLEIQQHDTTGSLPAAVYKKEAEAARAKRLREKRQDAAVAEALRKGDAKLEPALAARAASLRRVWKREPKGHELFKIFDRNGRGFELAELRRMIRRDLRLKPCLLYTSPSPRD